MRSTDVGETDIFKPFPVIFLCSKIRLAAVARYLKAVEIGSEVALLVWLITTQHILDGIPHIKMTWTRKASMSEK